MANEKELAFSIKILGTDREVNTIKQLKDELKSVNDSIANAQIGSDKYKVLGNQAAQLTSELSKLAKEQKITQAAFDGVKLPISSVSQMKSEVAALELKLLTSRKGIELSNEEWDRYSKKVLENKKAIADHSASLSLSANSMKTVSDLMKAGVDIYSVQNNSIKENRELLKVLNSEYIALKKPTEEQTKAVRDLTDTLKSQESAIGNNTRNVGNYQGALGKATSDIKIFGVSLGSIETTFNKYNDALKDGKEKLAAYVTGQTASDGITKLSIISTGGLSAAMNVFKLALIATGIGAFVVILGSLVAAFASTEKGMDLINEKVTQAKAIFSSLLGVAQDLGLKLISMFENPKKSLSDLVDFMKNNLINRLTGFKVVLDAILSGDSTKLQDGLAQIATGVTDMHAKIEASAKSAAKFLGEASAKGKELFALNEAIEELEVSIEKKKAETASRETELLIIAKSVTSTNAERKKAVDEILANTKSLQGVEEDIINKKIAALKLQQSLSSITKKDEKELADLEAQRIKVQDAGKDKQLELIKLLNKEDKESLKQAEDAAKKKAEAQKKYLDDINKLTDEFILNERQRLAKSFDDKLAQVTGEGAKEVAIRAAINAAKLKAIEDFDKKVAKTEEDNAAERIAAAHQAALDVLNAQLVALEQSGDRSGSKDKRVEIEEETQRAILADTKKTAEEKELLIAESDARINDILKTDAQAEIDIEKDKRDQMISLVSDYANNVSSFLGSLSDLVTAVNKAETDSYAAEIETRKGKISDLESHVQKSTGRQKVLYQQQLAAETAALHKAEKEKEEARLKGAKAHKAIAIIQATISTALAVVNALATAPNFIAGIIFAVLAGIAGAIQIGIIAAAPLARGGSLDGDISGDGIPSGAGMIQGPSHANGGVKFKYRGRNYEAEGGELKTNNGPSRYIFTRRVAEDPVLKQIALATHNNQGHPIAGLVGSIVNTAAGGRGFGITGDGMLASGGNLDNVIGDPLGAPVVVTNSTDPAIIQLIASVNDNANQSRELAIAANNRIDNLKIAVPVDEINDVQGKQQEVKAAGLF